MSKAQRILAAGLMVIFTGSLRATDADAAAESRLAHLIFDVRPVSVLISPNADDLTAYNGAHTEGSESALSWSPSFRMGLGLDMPVMDLELTAGAGALYNTDYYGGYYLFDLGFMFKVRDTVRFGPHLGVMTFDSVHYNGNANLELNNNSGWLGGLALTVNSGRLQWLMALDYLDCELEIEKGLGWAVNHDELDISGVMFQFGFIYRF